MKRTSLNISQNNYEATENLKKSFNSKISTTNVINIAMKEFFKNNDITQQKQIIKDYDIL